MFYVESRAELDTEKQNRDDYNSLMLWMIAQPTRKDPENLPRYESAFCTQKVQSTKDAGEIMKELMEWTS